MAPDSSSARPAFWADDPGRLEWERLCAAKPSPKAEITIVCRACQDEKRKADHLAWVYRLPDGERLWRGALPLRPTPPHYGAPLANPKSPKRTREDYQLESAWGATLKADCRRHGERIVPADKLNGLTGRGFLPV